MTAQPQTLAQAGATTPHSSGFDRFAGASGVAAGIAGLLYAVAFVVQRSVLLSGLWLMLGALAGGVLLLALYDRLRAVDAGAARLALALGGVGAVGALLHGGYDLANAVNPPAELPGNLANLPSAVDPRGLLTFGVAGLGVALSAWLMHRSGRFPVGLAMVGYLLAALELGLYLGRLVILDAGSPLIVAPALLCGFLINPLWNCWLGLRIMRQR